MVTSMESAFENQSHSLILGLDSFCEDPGRWAPFSRGGFGRWFAENVRTVLGISTKRLPSIEKAFQCLDIEGVLQLEVVSNSSELPSPGVSDGMGGRSELSKRFSQCGLRRPLW